MPIINFSQPFSIFIGVVLFVLVLYLARENKKAWIVGTMLFAFLFLLVGHTVEFMLFSAQSEEIYHAITTSATIDLIFVFLAFVSYLWIDDMEVKEGRRKSIDNSLDWFWNKI